MPEPPFVSLVIPCRDEKGYIAECLDSIDASDYPKDKLQVMVVDGMSDDGTREIVKRISEKTGYVTLLDNPRRITSAALNIGVNEAKGEFVLILGSHSKISADFIRKNVTSFKGNDADGVGGVLITEPANDSVLARSIAIALSCPFGVGNSYFRIGSTSSRYVDTVPFGCYRRDIFKEVGLFDEDLVRNQDDELNLRLIRNGRKLFLNPEIVSYYYARDSLLKVWKMYYQYGYFKPLVAMKVQSVLTWRQLMPAVFVGSLLLSGMASFFMETARWMLFSLLLSYLLANLGFSASIGIKKGAKYLVALPLVFAAIHFSYGAGYLKGILDFVLLKKHLRKKIADAPLTR